MAAASQIPSDAVARGPIGVQFARHMELRGRRIVEAGGVLWQSVGKGMLISIPCQLRLDWDRAVVDHFLRSARAVGVRFPSSTRRGLASGLYVFRGRTYDFQNLHRNFRQKVRHGEQRCEVRPVQHDELAREGLELNLETMQRQQRFDAEFGDRRRFERIVDAVFAVPAMAVMGAFVDGRLSAYDITCKEDGWLHIVHKMSRFSDLEHCPNHILDYVVTRDAVAEGSLQAVTMGWRSLAAMDGLHDYKTRLGYELEPHDCVIQFHPAVAPLLTAHPTLEAVDKWSRIRPRSPQAALAATLLHAAADTRGCGETHV